MGKKVLEGLKVVDFGWIGVGPISAAFLGAHGATVIRVESELRPDGLRSMSPFKDNKPGLNRSAFYTKANFCKYGISLNLTHAKGVEVAKRLVKWCDVVIEGYTPGTLKKWGLTYEELRKVKPDIIMISTSQQGETGPHCKMPGFGSQLVALAGFSFLAGWPDLDPCGPFGAYTDFISVEIFFLALTSALLHRLRTGEGQYIDISQFEASVHFLAPVILDYNVNGEIWNRMGNRSFHAAPHNAYRCKGKDRWCVISVRSDDEWKSFCEVLNNREWTKDVKFATIRSRLKHEEELNRRVEKWTKYKTAEEVMSLMQNAGVSAGVVQTAQDIHNDIQLKHYHFLWELEHREIGKHHYDGIPFILSKTPNEIKMAAPCLGEHNEYVYKEILGMSEEEYVDLLVEGVFE